MKASEFEAKFATGEDLTEDLDLARARRVNHIVLTAWKGGTFGLQVREEDRYRFAGRRKVVIILPGLGRSSRQVTANITWSFRRKMSGVAERGDRPVVEGALLASVVETSAAEIRGEAILPR